MTMPRSFELTQAQSAYLDIWMNRVSRSFALVVPWLEEPLNHFLATAYLLCRVADNIEDSRQPFVWKEQRFHEFLGLLADPALAASVLSGWDAQSWPGLTADERATMGPQDGLQLWQIYALIPDEPRVVIRHWVSSLAEGMRQIEDPRQPPSLVSRRGARLPASVEDYNGYCYFVAGTVGHMATELVIQHYGLADDIAIQLRANCEACGRGLQKTNILKDYATDLSRGISYLPDEWLREAEYAPLSLDGAPAAWKKKVIDDAMDELRDATDYVLALPYNAVGYRIASLVCLLPAYQTILLAAERHKELFTSDHKVKISRPTMFRCLQDAQAMVADNEAIVLYGRRVERAVSAAFEASVREPLAVLVPR